MKVLKFIGALIYGALIFYLIFLLFYWLTPIIMRFTWLALIVYLCLAGGFFTMFVGSIAGILIAPLCWLCRGSKFARFVHIPFGLFYGYCSIILPWCVFSDMGVLQWILAIALTITVLITFITLMVAPIMYSDDK